MTDDGAVVLARARVDRCLVEWRSARDEVEDAERALRVARERLSAAGELFAEAKSVALALMRPEPWRVDV